MTDTFEELAAECEQAKAGGVGETKALLESADALVIAGRIDDATWSRFVKLLNVDAYLDAARLLLPSSATNESLFSYGTGWAFSFMDKAQTMGERAAKEEIARLQKIEPLFNELRGEPLIKWEKAIAEHWLEFISRGAPTAGLAVAAASLRSAASLAEAA